MSFHRHLAEQARGLMALVRFVARQPSSAAPVVPGPVLESVVPEPSNALVSDFVRFCHGDPSFYRERLPPHLFPQWCLPILLETAKQLPYPPIKVINAGFRLSIDRPLFPNTSLHLRSQLLHVEETDNSARVTIRVETGAVGEPIALSADLRVLVRLPHKEEGQAKPRPKKEKPRVPNDARELQRVRLRPQAGLHFAELTGDFNPIHWLGPYARAMGFKGTILHGFGTAALAFEAVARAMLSGRVERIRSLDADFVRPLVLPANVAVYASRETESGALKVMVGDAPGGPAYLVSTFSLQA